MRRPSLPTVVIACAFGGVVSAQQAAPARSPSLVPAKPAVAMSGVWDYNDALSVDAATSRPEQAPLSATQRPRRGLPSPSGGASGSGIGAAGTGGSGNGGPATGGSSTTGPSSSASTIGGAAGGSVDEFERSVQAMYINERRALMRDLLEVPELLRIRVTSTGVTFTDDLQRVRTYPANSKMQKYQIGAAQFEARAYWDGPQFRKDIEGPNKFLMSELYFLSDDGARLFVVIRIGDPHKPDTIIGVNRVYDRVGR